MNWCRGKPDGGRVMRFPRYLKSVFGPMITADTVSANRELAGTTIVATDRDNRCNRSLTPFSTLSRFLSYIS